MISIVDYGAGNLRSVKNAFLYLGASVRIASSPEHLEDVEKIVLPGVGAFGQGMKALRDKDFVRPIRQAVQKGIPLLGICLGLQYLFESSDEMGQHKGLGLIPGHVTRFPDTGLKVPHIGWNSLDFKQKHPLISGLPEKSYAYFVHSYYVIPDEENDVIANTQYGIRFGSIVARDNIFGIQCHPEKSQSVGLRILKNFIDMEGSHDHLSGN